MSSPTVTFVISTHNRRDALLRTLRIVNNPSICAAMCETIVIDNASTDGSADAVASQFPQVVLLRQATNRGACTKNLGLAIARGQYIVFLDDDSFPTGGSIDRMIAHFQADPNLGAAIFRVRLPSGAEECSAYPNVFVGCGVGLRAGALAQVGGLPDDFFMQAEEYDLSLRLLDAGWSVRRFEDLSVAHLKTGISRFPDRIMRFDVRNNLTIVGRYFPDKWVIPYARDWAMRYRLMAKASGRMWAYRAGLAAGMARLATGGQRRPMGDDAFEVFSRIDEIETRLAQAFSEHKPKRLLLVDLGKNMLPYWRAARRLGVKVLAVSDASLGGRRFRYRRTPIVDDAAALKLPFDAALISNCSPVHAKLRLKHFRENTQRPVIDLFEAA